jgi:hypothetical protein
VPFADVGLQIVLVLKQIESGAIGGVPFATTHALLRKEVERKTSNLMALFGDAKLSMEQA